MTDVTLSDCFLFLTQQISADLQQERYAVDDDIDVETKNHGKNQLNNMLITRALYCRVTYHTYVT